MPTQSQPASVFCSPDMMENVRRQYPANVSVELCEFIEQTPTDFSASKSLASYQPSKVEQRASELSTADKIKAVNMSPAARSFEAEFELPGQQSTTVSTQTHATSKATALTLPTSEKTTPRAGLKPSALAFMKEFSLPS